MSVLLFTHVWRENSLIHTFSKSISTLHAELIYVSFYRSVNTGVRTCVRIHWRTLLRSLTLLLLHCSAYLVHLNWLVCMWWEVSGCRTTVLWNVSSRIYSTLHLAFFSKCFIKTQIVQAYNIREFPFYFIRDQISIWLLTSRLQSMLYLCVYWHCFR